MSHIQVKHPVANIEQEEQAWKQAARDLIDPARSNPGGRRAAYLDLSVRVAIQLRTRRMKNSSGSIKISGANTKS